LPNAESEPLAIVDRSRLADHLLAASDERSTDDTDAVPATIVLAIGERADTVSIPGEPNEILRRSDVLSESRDGALVAGVASATAFSLVGTALLGALALVVTTVIGVRRRGRTLALLGALGASRRTGIALASGELAPLVIGGMLGGAFAAAGTLLAVGSALGVEIIAWGTAAITIPIWLLGAIVAVSAAGLALAVAVDLPLSRRISTADILRTGEES
jgi:putative ABC transport system permease protein